MIRIGPVDASGFLRGVEQRVALAKRDALLLGKTLGPGYVQGNFRRQEGPGGRKWPDTLNKREAFSDPFQVQRSRKGSQIFVNKLGRMSKGITAEIRGDTVWIGAGEATKAYNAIHNFGGTTSAHVIRPKASRVAKFEERKQQTLSRTARKAGKRRPVLAFPWKGGTGFFAFVNHPGSKIPERRFMYLRDEDREKLTRLMQALFIKRINQR